MKCLVSVRESPQSLQSPTTLTRSQSPDYKSPPPVSNHQSTISTHSSQAITVWSTVCTARQAFHVYLPNPLTFLAFQCSIPCAPTFQSSAVSSSTAPPDLLDTEKDNYTQVSPLKDSYSPPTHLDIVLFSFPSAPLNKPVDYCTYLCVLCLSADS